MRYHAAHSKHRADFLARPKSRPMGSELELYAVRKDGREIPVEISLSPLETEPGLLVSAAIRDVSVQKEMARQLVDYRLKSSTALLLRQRQQRLTEQLGEIQVPAITTQLLREAVASSSQFEQSKLRALLLRFFKYAKSTGVYPAHLAPGARHRGDQR
jgi:hypothetical protein